MYSNKLILSCALLFMMIINAGAQSKVCKCAMNPVLTCGPPGSWDETNVCSPCVLEIDGMYHMWYTGSDFIGRMGIGYAISSDGINWSKSEANPVLMVGSRGEWDYAWVGGCEVVYKDGEYLMWYSGGKLMVVDELMPAGIGYARSSDGIHWKKSEDNPVIAPIGAGGFKTQGVYAPSIFISESDKYYIWYPSYTGASEGINLATSVNGTDWEKYDENPVLTPTFNWEADIVSSPVVYANKAGFIMFYEGNNGSTYGIGSAESPDGKIWTKRSTKPCISNGKCFARDESRIGNGSVIEKNEIYQFWYTAKYKGRWEICYAQDYQNIPHVEILQCESFFEVPQEDVLCLSATICTKSEERLSVSARVNCLESDFCDSFKMVEGKKNTWYGQWQIPKKERTYQVAVNVDCKESNSQYCSEYWQPKRFTTIGPVLVKDIKFGEIDGLRLPVNISLQNLSSQATAPNVTAWITSPDDHLVNRVEKEFSFGDIPAGQIVQSSHAINLVFNDVHTQIPDFNYEVHIAYDELEVISHTLTAIDIQTDIQIPSEISLAQNYPNPFNPSTTINFSLPENENVILKIYNVLGQQITVLINEDLERGEYSYNWNAQNLPGGIYYCQLIVGDSKHVKKMILLR